MSVFPRKFNPMVELSQEACLVIASIETDRAGMKLAPDIASSVTLRKIFNLSDTQFPHF
jgi:hypothetical protein